MSIIYNTVNILGAGAADNPALGSTALYIKNNNDMLLIECGASTFNDLKTKNLLSNLANLYVIISSSNPEHFSSLGDLIKYCHLFGTQNIYVYSPCFDTIKETLDKYGLVPNIHYNYSLIDIHDEYLEGSSSGYKIKNANGSAWIYEDDLHIKITAQKNVFDPAVSSYGMLIETYKPSSTVSTSLTGYTVTASSYDKENVIKILQENNIADVQVIDYTMPGFVPTSNMIPIGGTAVNNFNYGTGEANRIAGQDRYDTAQKFKAWIDSTSHIYYNNKGYIVTCHGTDKENVNALINKYGITDIKVLDDTAASFSADSTMYPVGGVAVNDHTGYDETKRIAGATSTETASKFESWIQSTPHTKNLNGIIIGWDKDIVIYYSGDTSEFGELAYDNRDIINKYYYIARSSRNLYPYNITPTELSNFAGSVIVSKITLLGLDSGADLTAIRNLGFTIGDPNNSSSTTYVPETSTSISITDPVLTIEDVQIPEPLLYRNVYNSKDNSSTTVDFDNNIQYDNINLTLVFNTATIDNTEFTYELRIDSNSVGIKFADKDGLYYNIGINSVSFRGEHTIDAIVTHIATQKKYMKSYTVEYIYYTYYDDNIIIDNVLTNYVKAAIDMYDTMPDDNYIDKVKITSKLIENSHGYVLAKKSNPPVSAVLLYKTNTGSFYVDIDAIKKYYINKTDVNNQSINTISLDYVFGETPKIIINDITQDGIIDLFYFINTN